MRYSVSEPFVPDEPGVETSPRESRRMGETFNNRARTGGPATLPVVPPGGWKRPPHILFRYVRTRMEASHESRLSSRKGLRARQRDLRAMWCKYGHDAQRYAEARFRGAAPVSEDMGAARRSAQIFLGCRSHRARCGRRRTVRSFEYAHTLPLVSSRGDGSAAEAVGESYFLKSRSKASRASLAFRGGGVLRLGAGGLFMPF